MYTVLIAGGHVSGKSQLVKEIILNLKSATNEKFDIKFRVFDVADYQHKAYTPQVNFTQLKTDLKEFKLQDDRYSIAFVHGNYALYDSELCEQSQLRVFLDTAPDVRLSQWILRDVKDNSGEQLQRVLSAYLDKARPEFKEHIQRTQINADILLPRGADPENVQFFTDGIYNEMKSHIDFRNTLNNSTSMANIQAEVAKVHETQYYSNN